MSQTLNAHARLLTGKLLYRASLIAFAFFSLGFGYFVFSSDRKVRSIFTDQKQSIEYWYQLGDTFQLRRYLSALVATGSVQSVDIIDLGSKASVFRVENFKPSPTAWERTQSFDLIDQTGNKIATLSASYVIYILPILAAVFIMGLLLFLFRVSIERSLGNLVGDILSPVHHLISQLEGLDSTTQLGQISTDNQTVKEMLYLATTIKVMAGRIDRVEREKQALAQEALLVSVSRQVAHDIRSPLSALNIISRKALGLSTIERELFLKATTQISLIADDLLDETRVRSRTDVHASENGFLDFDCLQLLKEVAELKAMEWRDRCSAQIEVEVIKVYPCRWIV